MSRARCPSASPNGRPPSSFCLTCRQVRQQPGGLVLITAVAPRWPGGWPANAPVVVPGRMSAAAAAQKRRFTHHRHRTLTTLLRPVQDGRNLGTYWAQRAAAGRPHPGSTGRVTVIDHPLRTRIAAADNQVRAQMHTSTCWWATMQRVPGRCSSVGRAAVL